MRQCDLPRVIFMGSETRALSTELHPNPFGSRPLGRPSRVLCLLTLIFATACTATPVAVCPEPVVYTAAEQKAVADELRAIPAPCVTCRFMTDYAQERAKLRVCQ